LGGLRFRTSEILPLPVFTPAIPPWEFFMSSNGWHDSARLGGTGSPARFGGKSLRPNISFDGFSSQLV
jgi:hypothetical protein